MHQISLAVEFLHVHNPPIMHGDLSMSNLLLSTTGQLKLADFGSSVIMPSANATVASPFGTPVYRAPERFPPVPPSYIRRQSKAGLLTSRHPRDGPAESFPVSRATASLASDVWSLGK